MNYFRSKRFLDVLQDFERGDALDGKVDDYLPRMRDLLALLDNPERRFISVIVGGTNGKGTVCSLLAKILKASGRRVGLYTSPHLHSIRERIQIDCELISRDVWSDGVGEIQELSRGFESRGLGMYTKFEALTALAATVFAKEEVDIGIFEVGMGGRYDATNAWDSDLAVLTSINLDHTAILGETVGEIAQDKVHIVRAGKPILTTKNQLPEVLEILEFESHERQALLTVVDPKFEMDFLQERPETYLENASLAVEAGRLLLGQGMTNEVGQQVVSEHEWLGRFEWSSVGSRILLDGAHNPSAVRALVSDLVKISDRWTFLVGVNEGHDAAGILNTLHPIADEVILTRSGHPKAIPAKRLASQFPDGLGFRIVSGETEELERILEDPSRDGYLCVVGSLHLVARAREILNLVVDRDGFSEDVFLESLRCLKIACDNLNVDVEQCSEDGNVLRLMTESRPIYFQRNKHPFNDSVGASLASDKAYQYELFLQAGLGVPYTLKVFNPLADARFERYKTHSSVEDIIQDVERQFTYPVVVKRNQGSMAQKVYLEIDQTGLKQRLWELCEGSPYFDNVLLVQAFIEGPEYRVVASQDTVLIAYEKRNDLESDSADLNPLHQAGGYAERVTRPELLQELSEVTRSIAKVIDLGFFGIDVIQSSEGYKILEINPNPICHFYNSHHGRSDFIRIYENLLEKYVLRQIPDIRPYMGERVEAD